jgi:hypothetical protein
MAIRFQCAACGQPIEVDDEWAGKPVLCPYCSKAIAAPAESTLDEESRFGQASPMDTALPPPVPGGAIRSAYPSPNRIATVAIVLAVLEVCLFIVLAQVVSANRLELEEFAKAVGEAKGFAAMMEAQNQYFQARGGIPSWLVTLGLVQVAIILNWFPLVVCAIIGVTRPLRRKRAVAALCVSGLVPLIFCCTPILGSLGL